MTRRNVLKGARLNLCHAVLAVAVASCLAPVAAQAQSIDAKATFNIPAGDLASAIDAFSRQSRLQILYKPELLAGKRAKAISGDLTGSDALGRLIRGSGITWEKVNETTYVLRSNKSQTEPKPTPPNHDREATISTSDGEGNVTTLSEILVVGSKSLNVDARRTRDDVQPYVVFHRSDIERSMASNIEEFLMTRLPMNQARGTKSRNDVNSEAGNRSGFNLRGLGENQTLILVNGRRAPGVSTLKSGNLAQPDLNGIPIAAIERIEVLPTTASGIYGGGATGGVINVILRKDYVGSEFQVTYDNTFDTDSARRRVDFSTGISFEGGRSHAMLAGSYSDGNDLLVRDRDFAQRGRNFFFQNNPQGMLSARPAGTLPNVYNSTNAPLVLRNGTSLGSNTTTVPLDYLGGDGGAGLASGAGQTNIGVPNTPGEGAQSLSAVPKTKSIDLTVRRDFTDSIEAYVEYGKTRNESIARTPSPSLSVLLPSTLATNPFTTNVYVSFPLAGEALATSNLTISDTEKLNAGLIVKLSPSWSAGFDINRNKSKNTSQFSPMRFDSTLLSNAVQTGALNVLRDLDRAPIDYSPYLVDGDNSYGPAEGSLIEYAARTSGSLFKLPAGDVQLAAVMSVRREEAKSTVGVISSEYLGASAGPSSIEYRYFPSRYQDVQSAYVETSIPLVSSANKKALVSELDLQASVRHDRYKTASVPSGLRISLLSPDDPIPAFAYTVNRMESTDFTFGFKYRPLSDLVLRASYGTGFLAPSLAQVSPQELVIPRIALTDPKRSNVRMFIGPVLQLSGGSSSVLPENSKSFSAGMIYTPSFIPGLRVSVDYTRINKTDEMTTLTAQQVLDLEDELPGRITRGANLPGDPVGYAGQITAIDLTLFNTARSKMEATDIQLDYSVDLSTWGELQVYGVATAQTTLERQVVSTSPTVDRISFNDGPLKWRGNWGVNWQNGAWNASINTQWYDSYYIFTSTQTAASRATSVLNQGSEQVETQSYTDVFARYTLQRTFLKGLQVSAGIRNVLNDRPPTIATTDTRGGYSTYGDPRGRSYVVSLRKDF